MRQYLFGLEKRSRQTESIVRGEYISTTRSCFLSGNLGLIGFSVFTGEVIGNINTSDIRRAASVLIERLPVDGT